MPKRKRSERQTAPAPLETAAQEAVLDYSLQYAHAVRHIKCPLCGLQARVDLLDNGPYRPTSRVQRYGGTIPSTTGRMKDRPGVMKWDGPLELTGAERDMLLGKLRAALNLLGEKVVREGGRP